jgi:hypothetical protein
MNRDTYISTFHIATIYKNLLTFKFLIVIIMAVGNNECGSHGPLENCLKTI